MSLLDSLTDFGIKYEKPLSLVGTIWFAASCAVYARFISLPEIPFLTDRMAIYLSAGFNGVWWGFLRPQIQKRKAARMIANGSKGEISHG